MSLFLFLLVAILSLGGAVGVVATRNVVHAALFLLVSLIAVWNLPNSNYLLSNYLLNSNYLFLFILR